MPTLHDGTPDEWEGLFRSRSLHVVCVASGGLTMCDLAAATIGGMRQEDEVWPLTKQVNRLGETGTFWPRLSLTVVPQTKWETRGAPSDLAAFLRKCFLDVAEANRLHIKLPDVFVDLNPYGGAFSMRDAVPIAREVLSREATIVNLWFASEVT